MHGKIYDIPQEAMTEVFEFIERLLNQNYRNSYLGYLSSDDFDKKYTIRLTADLSGISIFNL